jgi:hypothetical protein
MNTQRFDYTDFTRLKIERALSVDILRADTYSLTIGDDFSRIKVEKNGDWLTIGRRGLDWIALFHPRPHIVITMPQLFELNLSGACQCKAIGFQSSELVVRISGASHLEIDRSSAGNFKVHVSGASNIAGGINLSGELLMDVSGASRVELAGNGSTARVELSGASQGRLSNLALLKADVKLSGASSAQVKVQENLDINLSGASRLEYAGRPSLGIIQINGASTLRQR